MSEKTQVCVEFGDDKNRNMVINLLRIRVRGRYSTANFFKSDDGGREIGSPMNQMPDIPGQRFAMDWSTGEYRVFDPLEKDEKLRARIYAVMRKGLIAISGDAIAPVDETSGKLDADQVKTILIELKRKVAQGQARVTKGSLPSDEELAKIAGKSLYDPWNDGRKPRYDEDVEEWRKELDKRAPA